MNPLVQLQQEGQSVWLDYIRRSLIESGELKQMVEEEGLRALKEQKRRVLQVNVGADATEGLRELAERLS